MDIEDIINNNSKLKNENKILENGNQIKDTIALKIFFQF
jgi:hypothetical protein